MAVATIAKSEFRRNENIVEGYGEVPAHECEDTGKTVYGLPGGLKTTCRESAIKFARSLDAEIRKHLKSVEQLSRSSIV